MTDLIDFLRARLDEDEDDAQEAAEEVGDGHWQQRNVRIVTVADRDSEVADYVVVECAAHIARHDPARVLAEVEAKRLIITELSALIASADADWRGPDVYDGIGGCERVLKLLALPYADHPAFSSAWRL